jgi:hypothetical protein
MGICPLCNGLEEYIGKCSTCGGSLVDAGKVTDYLDDYSAYMEINLMKMLDGDMNSLENGVCMHVVCCPSCHLEQIVSIHE